MIIAYCSLIIMNYNITTSIRYFRADQQRNLNLSNFGFSFTIYVYTSTLLTLLYLMNKSLTDHYKALTNMTDHTETVNFA